ncbi:hypothetical protein LX99_02383 [Mucilaginibacter oryzae]|uniref:Uncharacterized protein n=1 Tax=Mucilaginibacter oryzae TaxID=468058 RepID=A0A316HAL1_9SPHI|nr:hypothetical protein LX99_02383 [Mucilaginibacter oryzae]
MLTSDNFNNHLTYYSMVCSLLIVKKTALSYNYSPWVNSIWNDITLK